MSTSFLILSGFFSLLGWMMAVSWMFWERAVSTCSFSSFLLSFLAVMNFARPGGLLPFDGEFGVGMVEAALSAPLRPILPLGNMVALGFQQIDLVQVGLLAHLHDSDTEMPEHGGSAAVLLARFPVARLVHEGLPFHGADTQAADDDVDVDIPGTVVTVRVGADDGGMTGKVVLAELQAKGLRPLHGQAVL